MTYKKAFCLLSGLSVTFLSALVVFKIGWTQTITGLPQFSVQCPSEALAILVIGQSQASNTGQNRRMPQINKEAFAFAENSCFRLRDPIPGTGGRSGSIWPKFADEIKDGRGLIIANISISGSSIEQWTTEKSKKRIIQTLDSMRHAGYNDPMVILMQGETNGGLKTSRIEYRNHLIALIKLIPRSKWIITRESICYNNQEKWLPLDLARNDVAKMYNFVTIGPDIDRIHLGMRQDDKCHLLPTGQDWLASRLAKTVTSAMHDPEA